MRCKKHKDHPRNALDRYVAHSKPERQKATLAAYEKAVSEVTVFTAEQYSGNPCNLYA